MPSSSSAKLHYAASNCIRLQPELNNRRPYLGSSSLAIPLIESNWSRRDESKNAVQKHRSLTRIELLKAKNNWIQPADYWKFSYSEINLRKQISISFPDYFYGASSFISIYRSKNLWYPESKPISYRITSPYDLQTLKKMFTKPSIYSY